MNFLRISIIALLITIGFNMQAQEESKEVCLEKVRSYTHMANAGRALTGLGGGCLLGGGLLIMTLPQEYWSTNGYTISDMKKYDNQYVGGVILTSVGVGLLATGITLASVGKHSAKNYRQKMNYLSVHPFSNARGQGLMLTFNF